MRKSLLLIALLLVPSITWAGNIFESLAEGSDVESVIEAASNLRPESLRAAIDAGAEVNVRDEDGYTALILAARWNGNPEVVRVLLDAGAMVNARSNWGWTPLMYAARWNGNPDILQVLLDAGGEMSARTLDSRTALIYTAWLNENPAVFNCSWTQGMTFRRKTTRVRRLGITARILMPSKGRMFIGSHTIDASMTSSGC